MPALLVFLDGTFLPRTEARLSPDDRGFLLADGVYEVTRFYAGRPFRMDAHVRRLAASLRAVRIEGFEAEAYRAIAHRLIEANGLGGTDAVCYAQVTRGAAPRRHAFPEAGCVFHSMNP